jgi:LmbE family N-acetylglucosaminyl deacetylase
MNVLIVAHPDDEIIWFSPKYFDLIVIAFLARHDKPFAKYCRERALAEHPFKEKIISLGIDESGFWKDKNRIKQYQDSREKLYDALVRIKKQYVFTKIYTHNSEGEYGHDDHILVNEAVTAIFPEIEIICPISVNSREGEGKTIPMLNNHEVFEQVKAIYRKNNAWTWKNDYLPPTELFYSLHVGHVELIDDNN